MNSETYKGAYVIVGLEDSDKGIHKEFTLLKIHRFHGGDIPDYFNLAIFNFNHDPRVVVKKEEGVIEVTELVKGTGSRIYCHLVKRDDVWRYSMGLVGIKNNSIVNQDSSPSQGIVSYDKGRVLDDILRLCV